MPPIFTGKSSNMLDGGAIPAFPWRYGNRFRLLIDGPEFFPVMLDAIANARLCVLVEMYLAQSGRITDRFVRAFTGAAARGVKVLLLLDHFGSLGLRGADRKRLGDAGVHLAIFNPIVPYRLLANVRRDHRWWTIGAASAPATWTAGPCAGTWKPNKEIEDADEVAEMLRIDRRQSLEIDYRRWREQGAEDSGNPGCSSSTSGIGTRACTTAVGPIGATG